MPCAALDVVYWKVPWLSGLIFCIGCTAFYLVGLRGWSSVGLLSLISALHLLIRFAYYNGSKLLADANLMKPRRKPEAPAAWIAEEELQAHLSALTARINSLCKMGFSLAYCESNELTLATAAALLTLALLARLFGTVGLFFLTFLCVFGLPKLYEKKQPEIDAMLEVAKAKAAEKRVMCDAACTSAFNKLQAKLKQRKADDVSAEDKKKL